MRKFVVIFLLDDCKSNAFWFLFRNYVNDMLLLHADDTDDEDLEILLVDAFCKQPSSTELGYIINLESVDEQVCIDLFR